MTPSVVIRERIIREPLRFTLEFTIDNFNHYLTKGREFVTNGITMQELGITDLQGRWRLQVKPCYHAMETDETEVREVPYLSAYLRMTDADVESKSYSGEDNIYAHFQFRITTGKALTLITNSGSRSFSRTGADWGFTKLISHHRLLGTDKVPAEMMDNTITIIADVCMYREPQIGLVPVPGAVSAAKTNNFTKRQLDWIKSDQFQANTDFTLVSNDKRELRVNCFLLMAHSPVFAAMLTHDSQEKQNACCELADVDGECVEVLLEYLYSCGRETNRITDKNAEKVHSSCCYD